MRYRSGNRAIERRVKGGECGRKRRYPSRERADGAAFLLKANGVDKGEQRPYRCPHCGAWHVGRKS